MGQTANGDQLPVAEYAQKTFAWLVESVGAVVPLCNESREKPEPFGDGFCFQYQDLSIATAESCDALPLQKMPKESWLRLRDIRECSEIVGAHRVFAANAQGL